MDESDSTVSDHSIESDTKTSSKETMPGGSTKETRRKRKRAMLILGGIFLIIGLIWFIYWLIWGQFEVYTDDAYVNGNLVQLMSQVSGTVTEINTDETQFVEQGQWIIKLDTADTSIALQRAKANLAQTVRQVKQAFENAAVAQASLLVRETDRVKSDLDLKRRKGLLSERAISQEELQHYRTAATGSTAQYNLALHHFYSELALVENSRIYTHPLVERAKAELRKAYINSVRTTIVAPISGFIAKRSVQVGQHIMVNTPLLAIIPLNDVWVDANYKETQVDSLRIGQPVALYADAYPDVKYHGKIIGLGAGTGAAFALLPAQNATGNWIKIVQRLPVRISLDAQELKQHPLQIGLSVRVTTNIHNLKGDRLAVAKVSQKPIYTTHVYAQQLADADQLINQILQENAPDFYLPSTDSLSKKIIGNE